MSSEADCGCGPATASAAPRNRPGQAALSHRAGTYGSFLAGLHRALARQPGLRGLTTRDPSDPAIALLEAWAAVAEVLAFQGERLAQEGYLGTATTRDAVLLHASALGYELRPGVAANTRLALSLQLPAESPDAVTLAPGIAVQSVPGPGEQPQVFETVRELVAVRGLDDLRPALAELAAPAHGDDELVLAGTATGLRAGDRLLVVGAERLADPASERWDVRRVVAVRPVEADAPAVAAGGPGVPAHTVVGLEHPLGHDDPHIEPAAVGVEVHVLRDGVPLFGHAAMPWSALPVSMRVGELEPGTTTVLAGVFSSREATWVDAPLPEGTTRIELSRRVDGLFADSWAMIADPGYAELLRVTAVMEETLADYLLTAEASVLEVSGEGVDRFDRRSALVWCRSEQLPMGARPITSAVTGASVLLGVHAPAIGPGREVIVEGLRTDTGAHAAELAVVQAASDVVGPDGTNPVTLLTFEAALAHSYVRESVHLSANVVAATHGRGRAVVLGSGDGTGAFQRFPLPEGALTFVAADLAAEPTPTEVARGAASTLQVRVGGVSWAQVPTLHGQPPDARVFTARARPGDGRVEVAFGDGVTGARLPTGRDNVTATYRVGVGLAGQVGAGQLSLLLSRPLGLAGVRNPLSATGAADPEPRDEARQNAPVAIRTLDRVVSLADVADLARTFGGVAKAAAAWLWVGDERVVHVTVVPSDGSVPAPGGPLLSNLAHALDAARHPGAPIVVAPHVDVPVALRAGVVAHPDAVPDPVIAAARAALESAFSVAARDLAQPLAGSEVLAVLHGVPGVVAVDLDRLHPTGTAAGRLTQVPARPATATPAGPRAAELAWLDPAAIELPQVTR